MKIYKDFLKFEKSKAKLVMGLVFCVISFSWVFVKYYEGDNISFFDWTYSFVLVLNGIVNIIEGSFGVSILKVFGNAFLFIDNKKISLKENVFSKEKTLLWINVDSIGFKANHYYFKTKNNSPFELKLSKYDYYLVKKIKAVIEDLALKKEIRMIKK